MRFHFTIRDLLWLVAVLALAVGWWFNVVWMQRNLSEEALKQTVKATIKENQRESLDAPRAALQREALWMKERERREREKAASNRAGSVYAFLQTLDP